MMSHQAHVTMCPPNPVRNIPVVFGIIKGPAERVQALRSLRSIGERPASTYLTPTQQVMHLTCMLLPPQKLVAVSEQSAYGRYGNPNVLPRPAAALINGFGFHAFQVLTGILFRRLLHSLTMSSYFIFVY